MRVNTDRSTKLRVGSKRAPSDTTKLTPPYVLWSFTPMSTAEHPTIYLKDYTPCAFLIPNVELDVALYDDYTRVTSRLTVARNPAAPDAAAPLILDGEEVVL